MTREEIFSRFNIDDTHNQWDMSIDNWYSVELYRIMKGSLPSSDDLDVSYLLEFLFKFNNDFNFANEIREKYPLKWGSLFLTAKRNIYLTIEYLENNEKVDAFLKELKPNKLLKNIQPKKQPIPNPAGNRRQRRDKK